MKKIVYILPLIISINLIGNIIECNKNSKIIELFIFAGQSNAQGYMSNASKYPKKLSQLDRKIPFYWVTPTFSSSNGEWKTLMAQGGVFKDGHFGPEIYFARLLKKDGINVAIFKYSLGATSIAKDWKTPNSGGLYDKMILELKRAIKKLEDAGCRVEVKAFIWIQGESDAETKEMAIKYKTRLKKIINDIKEFLKPSNPIIILGVDEQHPFIKKNPEVLKAHKELANERKDTIFTSMIGLEKVDTTHLKPEEMIKHSERIYKAYKKMVNYY